MAEPDREAGDRRDDAARIVRFIAIKAAIFIGIPAVAAVIAVWLTLR